MRGNCVRLLFTLAVFFAVTPAARAQANDSERAGPRFLYAATEHAAPTPIDVSRTAILRKRLALNLEGVSVKRAIAIISEKSGIAVWYSDETLRPSGVVNLKANDITLAAALTSVLVESGVDVVFGRDGNATLVAQPAPLSGSLSGRVVDATTKQPLDNVAVSVGGKAPKAYTDASGSYTLTALQQGTTVTLRFRRLGYFAASISASVPDGVGSVPDVAMEAAPSGLDRVVVTGTVIPTSVRALPTPITIVPAKEIEQQNITSLDQVFFYMVPGGVSRDDGPGIGGYANFSVRGATDLGNSGTSTIKVLVDGVELDDPSRIRNIDPNSVERIEIVSGPQASTIYGSGASSGVMQIFTKHGSKGASGPVVSGKMQVGTMAHKYNPDDTPIRKDASLAVSGGSDVAGYALDGSWHGEGAFEKYRRGEQRNLHGGMHFDQGIISGDLSLRDTRIAYHQGLNLLDPVAIAQGRPVATTDPGNRYEYQISTLAGSITLQPVAGWRNTLTVGSDDNTFATFTRSSTTGTPDAVNQTNSAARSIHLSSTYDHSLGDALSYSVVAGGDRVGYVYTDLSQASRTTSHINGIFGQAQIAWRESLYLTGGMHGDQSPGENGTYWSPRIGLSFVHAYNDMTFKARAGFGSAVVLADPRNRFGFTTATEVRVPNPDLQPTLQRGIDLGGDLYFGSEASVGMTYYNQAAINQVGGITLPDTTARGVTETKSVNLGRVRNTGWEFTGSLTPSRTFAVRAQFGSARSVAEDISPLYVGTVKNGDVLPGIPKWTAGLTSTYTPFAGTTINVAATHMATWRNLDMYAFMKAIFSGQFRGDQTPYYVNYPAWTKFNVGITHVLTPWLSGYVQLDNAGNSYKYERLNVIQQAGRTTDVGFRFQTP